MRLAILASLALSACHCGDSDRLPDFTTKHGLSVYVDSGEADATVIEIQTDKLISNTGVPCCQGWNLYVSAYPIPYGDGEVAGLTLPSERVSYIQVESDPCANAFIHEMIHRALWLSTGDADSAHEVKRAWYYGDSWLLQTAREVKDSGVCP